MFTRILVPTDGSTLGTLSALEGVSMAQKYGAEVVGIFVARELQSQLLNFSEFRPKTYPTPDEHLQTAISAGDALMQPIKEAASKAGVKFTGLTKISNAAGRTIVETAEEHACNLIFMGSHGCAGWGHNLLGSVATKVLSTTRIPTLIYRLEKEPSLEEEHILRYSSPLGV